MKDLFGHVPARRSEQSRRTTLPAPWQRVDGGVGKIGARYTHPSGYWIEHCGHPTALWPYALYGPDGRMVLAPNGRAWQKLIYAALEVRRRLGGAA
jgi:hypothetical protein